MSRGHGYALLSGALIGAAIGLLVAPKKGEELRKDLKIKSNELYDVVASYDYAAGKEALNTKVNGFKQTVRDIDSQKLKDVSLESLNTLSDKAKELSSSAKKSLKKNTEEVTTEVSDIVEETEEDLFEEI